MLTRDGRGRHNNHCSGAAHPRWNSERMKSDEGYVKVRVGRDHPLADPNGYAYEHLIIWCAAGKPKPQSGQVMHRRNGDRTDNRLKNLELLKRGEHNHLHNLARGRDGRGRFLGKKAAGRLLDGREWNEYPVIGEE